MATVREVILKHHKRDDGTWNVKIRVGHKSKSAYIDTSHYVTARQLRKDFTLKDQFIIDLINPVLAEYRNQISKMGRLVDGLTAKEIADRLGRSDESEEPVNFGEFCRSHIAHLKAAGREKTAASLNTVYNSLCDYFGYPNFPATDINSNMLRSFEAYLRTERKITRVNQLGKTTTTTQKPVGSGIHNYMRDLRVLFNAARHLLNDEDRAIVRIKHYPFAKYKVGVAPATAKRNLTVKQLLDIKNATVEPGSRAELARDLFMLSFYLCGMNAKDFYVLDKAGLKRIEYNRSKTKGKRKDKAFISISVPEIAVPLLKKYIGTLSLRYSTPDNLNKALSIGLKSLGIVDGLTFYHARHSFGNLARNECRFSKDDVALAMNHVDQSRKTTDTYIAPDWKIVDEVQSGVLGLLQ